MPINKIIMKWSMLTSPHATHRKKKMQIVCIGTKNSTCRKMFSSTAILSYHWKQLLWHQILLNVHVIPRELSMLVNGIFPKQRHICSSAKTTPFGSSTSHIIGLTSSSPGNPLLSIHFSCPLRQTYWNQTFWTQQRKQGSGFSFTC